MARIWYGPPLHNTECAPATMYAMIHSNLANKGASLNNELLSISAIGNKLSYNVRGGHLSPTGSVINEANIQKINTIISKKLFEGSQEIDFQLEIHLSELPRLIDSAIAEGDFVTVCFSYNLYLSYLRSKGLESPCVKTFEVPALLGYGPSHCALILKQEGSEYLILDPDCKYSDTLVSEDLDNFIRTHDNLILRIEKNIFVSEILLGRVDSFDDLNRLVITTNITVRPEKPHKQLTMEEAFARKENKEVKT